MVLNGIEWYYIAIPEILDSYRFKGDFKELAKTIVPAITPVQAKAAITLLESLGMIQMNPFGFYEKVDATETIGEIRYSRRHHAKWFPRTTA